MSPRRLSVVSVILLGLGAGGCGTTSTSSAKNFNGEPKQVATTIDDLQAAGTKLDANKICGQLLSQALVTKIMQASKSSCSSAVKTSLKDVDAFELEVVKNGVTVTGTTATARVRSKAKGDDRVDTLQLVKEAQRSGGKTVQRWKISALAG